MLLIGVMIAIPCIIQVFIYSIYLFEARGVLICGKHLLGIYIKLHIFILVAYKVESTLS